ncbi:BnaC02g11980D [Brassica napus]|uniref:BnaC02g11980D protein n=1 Tax=Brassica napus TaxID=3708 RepID=A0A078H600_BRANA|nr:BnaC02g11980D [Brassica napus]
MGHCFKNLYWLSVGAQASDPVQRLLFRSGLLPPPPMVAMGRKGGERDTRPVDPMTGRFVDAEKKTPVIIDNQPKEEDNAQDKSP